MPGPGGCRRSAACARGLDPPLRRPGCDPRWAGPAAPRGARRRALRATATLGLDHTFVATRVGGRTIGRVDTPASSCPSERGGRLTSDRIGAGPAGRVRPAAVGSAAVGSDGFVPAPADSSSVPSAGSSSAPPSTSSSRQHRPLLRDAAGPARRETPPPAPGGRRAGSARAGFVGRTVGVRASSASGAAPASTARCGGSGDVRSTGWSWSVMEGLPSHAHAPRACGWDVAGTGRGSRRAPSRSIHWWVRTTRWVMSIVSADVREARSQQLARTEGAGLGGQIGLQRGQTVLRGGTDAQGEDAGPEVVDASRGPCGSGPTGASRRRGRPRTAASAAAGATSRSSTHQEQDVTSCCSDGSPPARTAAAVTVKPTGRAARQPRRQAGRVDPRPRGRRLDRGRRRAARHSDS